MSLAAVGAVCLGVVAGWAAESPRLRQHAVGELAVALAAVPPIAYLLASATEAWAAAVAVLAGFSARALLDAGLSRMATNRRRR